MTDTAEAEGSGADAARRDRPDKSARIAALEAENAALRRALARGGRDASRDAERRGGELAGERAGRAADAATARAAAAEAGARHGREAAGRADLAAAEGANEALRRANAELGASRAALREREERLRLVLDSAADYAIFATDLDRRVTSWNAGAERLTGWAEGEIVGRPVDNIFTPEDREAGAPEGEAARALADGRAANERWHVRKDGSRFWGSGLAMPLRDPAAGPGAPPLGLLKVMRDGTERRRAEEALRDSEARFRALVEASSNVFYCMSPDWSEMHQLSGGGFLADAPGPTRGWMEDYIHSDDRALVLAAIDDAIRRKGVFELEHRVRRPDGGLGWTHSRAVPMLDGDGGIAEWFGAATDVTARRDIEERLRDSEARFRNMADHAPVMMWVTDPGGHCTYLNRGWYEFTGQREEEAHGLGWTKAVHPDDQTFAEEAFLSANAARGPFRIEYRLRRTDGVYRWAIDAAAPRFGEDGAFLGYVGSVIDIDERREAEERRALLLAELNHRVKNTLAVVQSLAAQTARGAADLPAFTAAFQARLIALARAHDLLTRENWEGAPLGAVARASLAPLVGGSAQVDLSGLASGAVLPPAAALALAMALHELATNALKHGALSVPKGRVSVACRAAAEPCAAPIVEWVERGGPPVAGAPTKRGFGLRLLDRGVAAQSGVGADLRFEPEGVRCTLRLPHRQVGSPAQGA